MRSKQTWAGARAAQAITRRAHESKRDDKRKENSTSARMQPLDGRKCVFRHHASAPIQ